MINIHFEELINRYQISMSTIYRKVNQILKWKVHEEITTDQFATLSYISQHNGCTTTEIAHAFGVGKSAITNQVNRLHNKQLVCRTQDKADRRIIFLSISKKGKEVVQFTEKELTKAFTPLLAHFDDAEIHAFIQSLERLAHLLEKTDFHS